MSGYLCCSAKYGFNICPHDTCLACGQPHGNVNASSHSVPRGGKGGMGGGDRGDLAGRRRELKGRMGDEEGRYRGGESA